jgi:hypothetical protein
MMLIHREIWVLPDLPDLPVIPTWYDPPPTEARSYAAKAESQR